MPLETGSASRSHDESFDDLHLHLRDSHSADYRSSWESFDWRENLSRNGIDYIFRSTTKTDRLAGPRRQSPTFFQRGGGTISSENLLFIAPET